MPDPFDYEISYFINEIPAFPQEPENRYESTALTSQRVLARSLQNESRPFPQRPLR
jgi:hypothetical protein